MNYLEVTSQVKEWKLQLNILPDGEVSFTVNESHLAVGCSPREGAAIIREAVKMWLELLKKVPPDLELWCRPTAEDGLYIDRVYIYEKLGFVKDDENCLMALKEPLVAKSKRWTRTPRLRF